MCAGVATTCLNQWDCNVSFLMDRVRYVGSRPTVTVTQSVTSAPACWLAYISAHASASHRSEMRWRDAEMQLNNILASFLPCARTVLFTCCPMSTHYNTKHVTNITTKRSVLIGHDKVKFWVAESSGAWLYKQVNGLRSTLAMIHQAWSNDPANRLKPEHPHTWDDKLHSFHCDAVVKVVRCKTCSYHAFVSPIPTNIAKVTWHQCDKPAKCSICFHHFSFIVTRNAIGMQYSLIFTMNAVPLSWKWRLSRWSQWKSVVAPSVEGRSDPRAWRAAPHLRIPFPIR